MNKDDKLLREDDLRKISGGSNEIKTSPGGNPMLQAPQTDANDKNKLSEGVKKIFNN